MVRPLKTRPNKRLWGRCPKTTEKGYGEMGPRDTARLPRDFTDLPDFGKQKKRMKIKGNIGGNVTSRI